MTKHQENLYRMYQTTITYLNSKSDITSILPVFANVLSNVVAKANSIDALNTERQGITAGVTVLKNKERKELEDVLFKISTSVSLYGHLEGVTELVSSFDFQRTDIAKFRDSEIVTTANALYAAGQKYLSTLADYGVTAEMLENLQKENQDLIVAMGDSGSAFAESKTATASLKQMFDELRKLVDERLDKLVDYFKDTHPEFYEGYYAARNIIDR